MTQRIWSDGEAIIFAGSGDGVPNRMFPLGSLYCEISGDIVSARNDAGDVELRIHFSHIAQKLGQTFISANDAKLYLDTEFAKPLPIIGPSGPVGPAGPAGPAGPEGVRGADGFPLPLGGVDGQALVKNGNEIIWSIPTGTIDGGFF